GRAFGTTPWPWRRRDHRAQPGHTRWWKPSPGSTPPPAPSPTGTSPPVPEHHRATIVVSISAVSGSVASAPPYCPPHLVSRSSQVQAYGIGESPPARQPSLPPERPGPFPPHHGWSPPGPRPRRWH